VEGKHGALLIDHAKVLEQLNELTSRLSTSVFEEHALKLSECLARLQKQEEQQAHMRGQVENNTKILRDFKDAINSRLDKGDQRFQAHISQNDSEHSKLAIREQEDVEKLWTDLKKQESRMQEYTKTRVSEAVKVALNFDNKGGEEQKKMIQMVDRELLDPVRAELKKNYDRLTKHVGEAEQQRFDILRQVRAVEQKASETSASLGTHKKDTKEDLEKRPYTIDVQNLESSVRKDIAKLNTICEGLQTRTVLKLNEFVDHVGKLHETIDDHEHCLRHHAEEIENRSTKYDLLLCQSQIDKCVSQDEYSVELQDMKKVMSWQTSKIETLGLGLPTGKSKQYSSRNLPGNRRMTSRQSVKSNISGLVNLRGPNSTIERSVSVDKLSETSLEKDSDSQSAIPMSPAPSEGPKTSKAPSLKEENEVGDSGSKRSSPVIPSPVEGEDDDGYISDPPEEHGIEERFSLISAATSSVLGQQVEALAMSLLCVAHLALAKPKLGTSSQQNQDQKQEMLEELQALRHWITHKTMPPRWDPNKLTTMALQVTHQLSQRGPLRRQDGSDKKAGKTLTPDSSYDNLLLRDTSRRKLDAGESEQKKTDLWKTGKRSLALSKLMKLSASGDLNFGNPTGLSESIVVDMKKIGGEVGAKSATTLPQPKAQSGLLSARNRNLKTDRVELTGLTTLPPLTINGPQSAR